MTARKPREDPPRIYGYLEIAEQLEAHLGVRPALSTLRAAATRAGSALDYPPRVTAGMPPPLTPRTLPARFDADAIDRWIRRHPWRAQQQRLTALTAAAATNQPQQLEGAVAAARDAGVSWTAITTALRGGGWPYSRARTHQLFRDL
jgi:alkylhydroperoxidase/carboxymuconolactone decarboxylase family protein YurZ